MLVGSWAPASACVGPSSVITVHYFYRLAIGTSQTTVHIGKAELQLPRAVDRG